MLRKLLASFFLFLLTLSLFASSISAQTEPKEEVLEGEVVKVVNMQKEDPLGESYLFQDVEVKIYKGSLKSETINIVNDRISITNTPEYKEGDKVLILHTQNLYDGQDVFYITDYVRRDGLLILFIMFVILAIAIGGKWGVSSLLGMAFSFLVIFKFILPQIIDGKNAVLVAIVGSAIIIPVSFSLSHGLKMKTLIASAGTVIALIATGLLAYFAVNITHLTGFSSEEAAFVQTQLEGAVSTRGLLLAGMIIASLGILDDITISQASVVSELKKANKKYGPGQLFKKGMNVGRDHIASLINTLVLVYAGASLPLLLLFVNNPSPFSEVVNIEMIADEIVRTLVGSMGLILAVPITTFLAAYYYQKKL